MFFAVISQIDDDALALADEIHAALDQDPASALSMARQVEAPLTTHPTVRLALAHAVAEVEGVDQALAILRELVNDHPDDADARHALARLYEANGNHRAMVAEYLIVRELDAKHDAEHGFDLPRTSATIVNTTRRVIEELPESFRTRLGTVPVVVEARPAIELVREGFDPRSVGLFEGPDHGEHIFELSSLPPRIVLFAANLTASVDSDDAEALEREVEITVLHEVGHYFGLDEERLDDLGLG